MRGTHLKRRTLAIALASAAAICGLVPAILWGQPPASDDMPRLSPDNPVRDAYCMTQQFLDTVNARPGETIADVGAGAGYFTFKLAKAVGPEGRVVATEQSAFLVHAISAYAAAHGVKNVDPVFVDEKDSGLHGRVDAVAMFNLHSFCEPVATRLEFARLRTALHPRTRIVFWTDSSRLGAPNATCQLGLEEMQEALTGVYRVVPVALPPFCSGDPVAKGFLATLTPW